MKALELPDLASMLPPAGDDRGWLDEPAVRLRAGEHLRSELNRELWKYTPIKTFLDALAEPPEPRLATLLQAGQPGVRAAPLHELDPADQARVRGLVLDRLMPERHAVTDLALLRAASGWLVEVDGQVREPLEIHYPDQGIVPVFLLLAPGASLTLVEYASPLGFLARIGHAELGRGAHLRHYRAALTSNVAELATLGVRGDADSVYHLNQAAAGGNRRRAEVHVVLEGSGARAELSGAYMVQDRQHLDQQLIVEHRAGHTTSRQRFHGVGAGKGRSVFNGRIHIHRHCPESDARLDNRNLALHAEAEMNTKPELEIYTDDVRCAHGATVGQLSDDAVFYLVSRGIPEVRARELLAHGFVRECLEGPLAEAAQSLFMEALS